jgi:general secretion pathway protein H
MQTSAPGNDGAPTLAAKAAALPPEGARSPWGGPAANNTFRLTRGFTLIELLVVVAIIAMASAGVSFALRDSASTQLEREAQRLAALLESARAQSRTSGIAVRWFTVDGGFRFEGIQPNSLPEGWLDPGTQTPSPIALQLGPEPIIGRQEVVLTSRAQPERSLRIATDGLRPFKVAAGNEP